MGETITYWITFKKLGRWFKFTKQRLIRYLKGKKWMHYSLVCLIDEDISCKINLFIKKSFLYFFSELSTEN
jgi:hypothetical protein